MPAERDQSKLSEFSANLSAIERLQLSRRKLLGMGLAGLAIAADLKITEEVQAVRDHTHIAEISTPEAQENHPSSSWLLLPGFNTSWEGSRWIASSLQDTMEERGRVSYLGYSNKGLDIDEVKDSVETYVRNENLENVYLYGHSFSSMVALEVAEHLKKSTNVHIPLFTPDSSPSSEVDIYERKELDLLSLSYKNGFKITSALRGCMGLAERTANKNERTWREVVSQSLEDLLPGAASSALMQSQANYISNFRLKDHELPYETAVAMLANVNDETVNISQATAAWEDFCGLQFGGVYWTTGAKPAHASPNWNSKLYSLRLQAIQERFLPDPDDFTSIKRM